MAKCVDGDGATSCWICGWFVLQIAGWTAYVESYRRLPVSGALHFSCLPEWERTAAFRRALDEQLLAPPPGFGYAERVFVDGECAVYRNVAVERWLILSRRGPWFFLDARQLGALAQGLPARADEGGERVRLPEGLELEVDSAPPAELLEALAIRDRYPGLLEHGSPDYQVWRYFPKKRGLEYSVAVDLPLPRSAAEFLAGYAREYEPLRLTSSSSATYR